MAPMKRKGGPSKDSNLPSSGAKISPVDGRASKRQRKLEPSEGKATSKKDPKPTVAAVKGIQPSMLKEEEPAFPRGGASVLTPLEHKQIHIEATQDVLFEQRSGKKVQRGPESDEEELGESTSVISREKKLNPKNKNKKALPAAKKEDDGLRIEGLSYKRIVPGSLVLGQVSQINTHDIAIALPNNLTGYVPLTSISDELTKRVEALVEDEDDEESNDEGSVKDRDINLKSYFSIGQYLRAYVSSTSDESSNGTAKGKKRLELSLNPQQANTGLSKDDLVTNSMVQAAVISIEDNGLVMNLGLGDVTLKGFMSSKEVGHGVDHNEIEVGAVFLCLVTGLSPNGNVVKLSADAQKAGNLKKANFLSEAPTVDAFLPGTAVEILVAEVNSSGFAGKVMGLLDVTADLVHSGAGATEKDIGNRFKTGSKIKGRIISTFPTVEPKKLGVSVLDHVLSLSSQRPKGIKERIPLDVLPISTILEEAKVIKVEPGVGLFLDVGVKGVHGFVHISRVVDGKIETLSASTGQHKIGSTHRTRILGYNAMDGLFMASMEEKILNQAFLRIEDIKVGEVVKGKVEKLIINPAGIPDVLINLAEGIIGLVPNIHLADAHLQHPEKKFKEGMLVTARVLSTDPAKRKLRLTLKKSLVNSEGSIWASYEGIVPGSQSPGTLVNILHTGARVQFYGNVNAFLPVSEMSEAYIEDPKQHFRVGQVVNVHTLTIDPDKQKMIVSCKDPSVFGQAQQSALTSLKPGTLVNGTVIEKSNDNVVLELNETKLRAIIVLGQLVDGSDKKCISVMKNIRVGQTMQNLVVLDKSEKKKLVILSNKSSLVEEAKIGKLLTSFEDVKEGETVKGFVDNVRLYEVFLRFAGGLTGLLPKSQLPEDAVRLPDFGMKKHQSISARILSVDHGQRRFLLSLKDSETSEVTPATVKTTNSSPDEVVSNPIDGESSSIHDFTLGKLTKARIVSVKETQLNVHLGDNIQGRIDVSELFDSWEDIKDRKHPLKSFSTKQTLDVRILGIHDARNHRFLPITHRAGRVPVFELSAKPRSTATPDIDILTLDKVKIGSSWIAFVNNVADDYLWLNLSPNIRGRIKAVDISDDLSLLKDLDTNFPVGSALKVHVTNVDVANSRLDLSARSDTSMDTLTFSSLSIGLILPGRVTRVSERQIMVQLSDTVSGPVNLVDLADDYSEADPTIYNKNDIVRVCVTHVNVPNKRISLSTRPSRVLNSSLPVKDPEITGISQIKINDVLRGFVKNVSDKGVFVSLATDVTAYVRVSELSDSFIKDWKSQFQVDQLIKGKIIAVDPFSNHIQMSLKSSIIDKNYIPPINFSDLSVGQVVVGKVRKVEDFGVFIVVDGSANVSGLCHRSEMAEQRVSDVKKLYDEGDVVKAKVLKIEPEKRQISFGLKASYFLNVDSDMADSDEDDTNKMKGIELAGIDSEYEDDTNKMKGIELAGIDSEYEDEDMDGGIDLDNVKDFVEDVDAEDVMSDADRPMASGSFQGTVAGLSTAGFDWTGGLLDEDEKRLDYESDEENADSKSKKKRRRKAEIKVDRTGDLDANGPQSVADFERLLLGQPDSSFLWLSYMAFQLQLSEVGKAREISERAIRTINIREETEKMNVWVALLNLENTYGSDETVEEAFERACQFNDGQEIHERLSSIYIQSGKNEKADELFQSMVKKFSQDPKIWLNYATFLTTTLKSPDRARGLLPRAMQSLPQYAHLDLTSKFAQLEFRSMHGDPERGRTMFEGLLSTFPKRLDLWNVLLDLEMKQGDKEQVRRLFGRITAGQLKSRKAKFFFKRWLQYEEKEGDGGSIDVVKGRAAEYVRQQGAEKVDR